MSDRTDRTDRSAPSSARSSGEVSPGWFDNHCHLGGSDAAAELVRDARDAGVLGMIDVATDAPSALRCLEVAGGFDDVWATAGVHPHDAAGGTAELVDVVDRAIRSADPNLVAIGECGLDHHYDHSPRDAQVQAFVEQIELANRCDLPLVIHTREAWEETFDLLDRYGMPQSTVFHCFTGGPDEAERCVEMGAHLSISGIVTFNSAKDLRAAVAAAPLDRLMVETDSPYLAPVPHRGRPNRPALVAHVGAEVAALQGRRVDDVASITTATARRFYRLDDRRELG